MKKLLPFAPLLTLIVGSIVVQTTQTPQGLLSSIVHPDSSSDISRICSKPPQFSREGESAWCNTGLVTDIEERQNTWNWSCLVDEKTYSCYFTETKNYPVKGALFFDK